MATIEDKIRDLEEKLKQAKAQKQQLEARKRIAESKAQRTIDTRKKILVGAIVLANVESGKFPKEKLLALLDSVLTRPDDRALFDLPAQLVEPVAPVVAPVDSPPRSAEPPSDPPEDPVVAGFRQIHQRNLRG